jgi:transcription elongation factor Elf1
MKEITCPYSWSCGKKFQPKELTRFDYNFLQSAIEKKMKFMFIHCPKCTQSFQFDPIKWKSTASFPNPHKKKVSKKED